MINYFTFNDDLFNCDISINQSLNLIQPIIVIQIIDSAGNNITGNYSFTIRNPSGASCEPGCTSVLLADNNDACKCSSGSSLFDISGQIGRIFSNSNLNKVFSQPFAGWTVYDSIQFWIIVSVGIITGATILSVQKFIPKYCSILKLLEKPKAGFGDIFKTGFLVRNLQKYMIDDILEFRILQKVYSKL